MLSKAARACSRMPRTPVASAAAALGPRRDYHFASSGYASCFGNYPAVKADTMRQDAAALVRKHEANPSAWYEEPVVTVLRGSKLTAGSTSETVDAFGKVNGKIVHATDAEVQSVVDHLQSFKPPKDLREQVRAMENEVLSTYAAQIIANQALDFKKQDGVTEIEESIEANKVEQRLNDLFLADEARGIVDVCRAPCFVACVSNFSNFLDLCRKVLRHMEVGVPCVVLSRENVTQHMFRWATLLVELMPKYGIDTGMLTYLSSTRPKFAEVFGQFRDGPIHITCSRSVAEIVRGIHGNVLSSTGGPNTLVATRATPQVMDAIRMSASIENSGQCTALRHAVVNTDETGVTAMLDGIRNVQSPSESLDAGEFSNVLNGHPFEAEAGYKLHKPKSAPDASVAYRLSSNLPPDHIQEHWRQVYVDVTSPEKQVGSDAEFVANTAKWLVRNQPISLAVNGDYNLALSLFEQTGQVVYTIGGVEEHVALSVAARPQDGEVFGEFPVRRDLFKYTKFPMVIPSPVAAYNSKYSEKYLVDLGRDASSAGLSAGVQGLLAPFAAEAQSDRTRGYMTELMRYLSDACGPREGWKSGQPGVRTVLYGLQRPPLNGQLTALRIDASASVDEVLPVALLFHATNARSQLRVSCDPSNTAVAEALGRAGIEVTVEAAFNAEPTEPWYNVIYPGKGVSLAEGFPLAQQYVSLWFPCGHVKSAKPQDNTFLETFRKSAKWLSLAAPVRESRM